MPDDQAYRDHVTASLAELTQITKTTNERLFGAPGQKGAIQYLVDGYERIEKESRERDEEIDNKYADKFGKVNDKVNWFSGLGSGLGILLGYFADKLKTLLIH